MNAHVAIEGLSDGIYFGLSEEAYRTDPALGSSDLKTLSVDPACYWFGSVHNPDRPEEEDKAHLTVGRAVHKFVLEGPQAFRALYERAPDGEGLLRTADDLASWLKTSEVKVPASKAARITAVRDHCTAAGWDLPRILDVIEQEAIDAGRTLLKHEDFDRITRAASAVLDNPHLAAAFTGGHPEVSIFWTEEIDGEHVRRKARFDYLKPRAVVDLKSTRPRLGLPFVECCRRALAEYNYPAQAAGYMQARERAATFAAQGRIHGDVNPEWVRLLAAARGFGFVFVFWANAGAPQTWGGIISIGASIQAVGEEYVRRGLKNFVSFRRAFGLTEPWVEHLPLEDIELEHLPKWYGNV